MSKLWKSVERKIAALLGGERVPITGRIRGSAPDIKHELFSIEVKHREHLPDWLLDAMNQADESNNGSQIPMVVLHEKNMMFLNCLCVLRLSDIIELAKIAKIGE
jgi:hypothetical protein